MPEIVPPKVAGHRLDPFRGAGGRPLGHRHRRRPGAGRVRRPGLLPVVEEAEPGHGDQRRLPASHPRGRAPVRARARLGDLLPDRDLPLADPRADPAPALLLLPAVPALRARARRRDGRAGRHRRRTPSCTPSSWPPARPRSRAYTELLEGLEKKFADVEHATLRRKQARQAARAVLPNATETRIVVTGNYRAWRHFVAMRASEHADVEIRALAIAACGAQAGRPERLRRLRDHRVARRHRGRGQPVRRRGLTPVASRDRRTVVLGHDLDVTPRARSGG